MWRKAERFLEETAYPASFTSGGAQGDAVCSEIRTDWLVARRNTVVGYEKAQKRASLLMMDKDTLEQLVLV